MILKPIFPFNPHRGRISSSGQVKLAVFFTLYTITYIALYIYEAEVSVTLIPCKPATLFSQIVLTYQ